MKAEQKKMQDPKYIKQQEQMKKAQERSDRLLMKRVEKEKAKEEREFLGAFNVGEEEQREQ